MSSMPGWAVGIRTFRPRSSCMPGRAGASKLSWPRSRAAWRKQAGCGASVGRLAGCGRRRAKAECDEMESRAVPFHRIRAPSSVIAPPVVNQQREPDAEYDRRQQAQRHGDVAGKAQGRVGLPDDIEQADAEAEHQGEYADGEQRSDAQLRSPGQSPALPCLMKASVDCRQLAVSLVRPIG